MTLTADDLSDLPPELLKELRGTKGNRIAKKMLQDIRAGKITQAAAARKMGVTRQAVSTALGKLPHQTRAVQVWVDADLGIADMVVYLNTILGVRTLASCQGTLGQGGPRPYRAQVMATWPDNKTFERLKSEFDVTELGIGWGYLHPRT